MREINLNAPAPQQYIRALVLGTIKSGKTHFAATCPKPLFISDVAEGGYETIRTMDRSLWWDEKVEPVVWAIENIFQDVNPMLTRLETLKAANTFPFQTVVIDPISLYADRYLSERLTILASSSKGGVDTRQLYGDLANHLRATVLRIHALPCHVLWLCHVKEGGANIAGSTAEKLPAYIHNIWLCENTLGAGYRLYTQPYGAYTILGGRTKLKASDGQLWGLPSPLLPSFKLVAQIFGLGDAPSPAVPGYPKGVRMTWPPVSTTEPVSAATSTNSQPNTTQTETKTETVTEST